MTLAQAFRQTTLLAVEKLAKMGYGETDTYPTHLPNAMDLEATQGKDSEGCYSYFPATGEEEYTFCGKKYTTSNLPDPATLSDEWVEWALTE